MLFNSLQFIYVFFPTVLAGALLLRSVKQSRWIVAWLVVSSLYFYGYWRVEYVGLILLSVAVNFATGKFILHAPERARGALIAGIIFNIGLLGFFKYANFTVANIEYLGGIDLPWEDIVLPIGISFYTFQQIAFLVDVYRDREMDERIGSYALFVTFFPQLIAGPIVHHKQIVPQLNRIDEPRDLGRDLAFGLFFFSIGLFKKVEIADRLAGLASPTFLLADQGAPIAGVSAAVATMAYGLQIYFDFSGYSDMAIGLARCFGIYLPINFNSPYQARSMIEFWRRWHMTLSQFLRDYLYIPLGGNRKGKWRRYVNLLITMLLGGLWHGAGWGFLLWGFLHGFYLIVNHAIRRIAGDPVAHPPVLATVIARLVTLLAVFLAWIPFRAETLTGARSMLLAIAQWCRSGFAGIGTELPAIAFVCAMMAIALFAPNSQTLLSEQTSPRGAWGTRALRPSFAVAMVILAAASIASMGTRVSEFLYFQF